MQLFTPQSGHLDEGIDDLSDSEESVFSGLEDSGSDESDDDDDEEEAEEVNSAEEEVDINENGKSMNEAESTEPSTKAGGKPQVWSVIFK